MMPGKKSNKENRLGNCPDKSDIGCAICMKTCTTAGEKTGVKMMQCSNCRGPRRYCSKECFKKDWSELGHKEQCQQLTKGIHIVDPKMQAKQAEELKEKANELFKAENYDEAILMYNEVKILAIQIKNAVKRKRMKNSKIGNENENCATMDDILKRELQVSHYVDLLEMEMSRLSAIAANNIAVTYNKMKKPTEAAACAREALKLDASFYYRILPQLLSALDALKASEEWNEMGRRLVNLQRAVEGGASETFALYNTGFISFNGMVEKEYEMFYKFIAKEKKLAKEGRNRFPAMPHSPKVNEKWGHVAVQMSLVPVYDAQMICLTMKNVAVMLLNNCIQSEKEHMEVIRLRVSDPKGTYDEVDTTICYRPPGSLSHVASLEALKNAYRELILFVNDIEKEGLAVNMIRLGAGLFHLLPKEDDPQKDQRKHGRKADKYILHPGKYIPEYCRVTPSPFHIRR